ncbi:hypothetical protein N0V93_000721 [Gnomoniopsis smithogilvyi]|uniref:Uncharacterized protein n=1 Tax=Gnomoniopsis smithogilvyi TaxID=1191159 RepID=A0A9W8Z0C6_9PEZI|nr:hypothetical protein N0V93_000721 [Gnomoniopsis smithogilvyi]
MPVSRSEPIEIDDDETASEPSADEASKTIAGSSKRKRQDIDVWADEPNAIEEYKNGAESDNGDSFLVPPHIAERRARFEENSKTLGHSGLRLAPDYEGLYFSDDERDPEELEERPKFDNIEPCRPYKDIELEGSAGLIPASIAQYLRDYQIEGVKFLHEHFVFQTGAILGDDMGLGKTVQVAAFLTAAFGKTGDERDAKRLRKVRRDSARWYPRVLIVCPGTLIANWKSELDRWGWWRVNTYHETGKDDALKAARSGAVEIMLTTYTTYTTNQAKINTVEWDAVVADECHCLKGRSSKVTQAMENINALCRIGLTGTAIQNKYEEFWALLNWTNPGYFGEPYEWNRSIVQPLTRGQSHDATMHQLSLARKTAKKLVNNLLPPFFLRRMKSLIAHQLPKKTDKVVFCPLTSVQKDAYKRLLEGVEVQLILSSVQPCSCGSGTKQGWCCGKTLPDGRTWMALVFPCIMALQKLSNHLTLLIPVEENDAKADQSKRENALNLFRQALPNMYQKLYQQRNQIQALAWPESCGKWKILKELLSLWHTSQDKVLIFSHSVRLLHILESLFRKTSYNVSFLSGDIKLADRQKEVDDFNSDPDKFVFLISTKAGGVGLNITSANKVVIFDPHWNPSYDLQAQDRAYRIGQLRDVEVYRLVSAGTIEEIVYARQIYKQQQANIGYNASSERRYFKGVQQDPDRKGELFGLKNLFSFHGDQVVLQGIVHNTNVAEARASVQMMDVDMDQVAEDDELKHIKVKKEDTGEDDGGLSQLAAYIKAEDPDELINKSKANKPKIDAIQAILLKAGVQYTHENSEVIGSSKVEAHLSRRAELVEPMDVDDVEGGSALFAEDVVDGALPARDTKALFVPKFKPPQEVICRQFHSMAREFGFDSVTEYALLVEQMTQEERRDVLDKFYKRRMMRLLDEELKKEEYADEEKVNILKAEAGISEDNSPITEHEVKVKDEQTPEPKDSVKPDIKTEVEINKEPDTTTCVAAAAELINGVRPISSIFIDDDDDDDDEF